MSELLCHLTVQGKAAKRSGDAEEAPSKKKVKVKVEAEGEGEGASSGTGRGRGGGAKPASGDAQFSREEVLQFVQAGTVTSPSLSLSLSCACTSPLVQYIV